MLADVTITWNLEGFAFEAIVTLLICGGLVFVLCNMVIGRTPIASPPRLPPAPDEANPLSAESALARAGLVPPGGAAAEPASSARGRERRISPRRRGNPVEVLVTQDAEAAQPFHALVIDRSRGGVQLALEKAVEVGSRLRLRPPSAAADLPCVEVLVRHCRARGNRWYLGCKFVEQHPLRVLTMFG